MLRSLILCSAIALVSNAAVAQTLADRKTEADIAKALADAELARANAVKVASDVMAATRTGLAAGQATLQSNDNSAEAVMLATWLQAKAADALAARTREWLKDNVDKPGDPSADKPATVTIVFGSEAPSVANYFAYENAKKSLTNSLAVANANWEAVARAHGRPARERQNLFANLKTKMLAEPVTTAAIALGAVNTALSFLRVDTAIAGASFATGDDQLRFLLGKALGDRGAKPAELAKESGFWEAEQKTEAFIKLTQLNQTASQYYYEDYAALIARSEEADETVASVVSEAGRGLKAAIDAFTAFQQSMNTPVNGVLPYTLIEREKNRHLARAKTPILYIRSHRTNVTSTTKRGLLSGIGGRVPAFVTAGMVIDYQLTASAPDAKPMSDTLRLMTPRVRVTDVAAVTGTTVVAARAEAQ